MKPGIGRGAGEYRKLCAVLDATKEQRKNYLYPVIRVQGYDETKRTPGLPGEPLLILAVVDAEGKTLATAPFEPKWPDEAALDVTRHLTMGQGLA